MNIFANNLIFLDVETPNHYNDAVSSLALYILKPSGELIEEAYLVDPETFFDEFNIQLTNIDRQKVKGQPTFGQLWPKLAAYFDDAIVVAHNATFDIGVLRKCLKRYGFIDPFHRYMCTYRLYRKYYQFPSYRLNKLCAYLDIPLDTHHDALCDTKACFELFMHLVSDVTLKENDIYYCR
ncbi:MAG: hypothetical protein MR210_02160 [Erysipelotrichaceae bacterium]|nr:hypothetical protein [Erysipelotrichaceae bacterium]MDY5251755.1 exonuclease domain-containing protein [Erysipelotrichaceae bacterium]